MTKRNWVLIFIALALAGVYAFYFTDWFKPKVIHITSINARISRPVRAPLPGFLARFANLVGANANNTAADSPTVPVLFKLDRPYKITEIKVVALDDWQTNKNCLPLWHLIAGSNSFRTSGPFTYGQPIRGLKPAVPGARPEPLQPGVKYRLFVAAGSARGAHDFQAVARPAAAGP